MKIRIGSRGSDLAMWQAHHVQDQLQNLGHEVEIIEIVTKGDRIQDLSFDKIEGKGFFTKEIEDALLNNEVDLAVHSHKDLETTMPPGLVIAAVSERANPSDSLLIRKEKVDQVHALNLCANAIVGTSSARRQSQLRRLRDDLDIRELRGNVPTRIQKLRDGQYDGIILATAGLKRLELDLSDLEVVELHKHEFVPAPAQGVLGLQIRETDSELMSELSKINSTSVSACIGVERDVLKKMEGGCQLPLGVYCQENANEYVVATSFAASKTETAQVEIFKSTELEGLSDLIVKSLKNETAEHSN